MTKEADVVHPLRNRFAKLSQHAHKIIIGSSVAAVLTTGGIGYALSTADSPDTAQAASLVAPRASQDAADRSYVRPSVPASPSPSAVVSRPAAPPRAAVPKSTKTATTRATSRATTAAAIPASCKPYAGNKLIACRLLPAYGFSSSQMDPLIKLWTRESNWQTTAENSSSGAYGIPQALPGDKMASIASDWRTNPATQITWGLGYIKDVYGSPAGAWAHSQATGWY
jgi:hypothetical protein